ncbi:hypothetical protein OROHE_016429 [Orobanche hederae]
MASSQTTSSTEKKKESIIDGRLFVQLVVMGRIQTKNDDVAVIEHVVSRIKQTGLFNLGRQHSDLYNESLVEEFYQEASVCFRPVKKGGDVAEISATIQGVEIHINRPLLEDLFSLPSFGAFEMCTNLHFRMMMVIMFGEPVNWCQIILKRLQEEVSKPLSQKKSFGLLLNNIFSCLDVPFAMNAKKIGPGKFIGGSKPTSFNKDIVPADNPSVFEVPQSANLRDSTKKFQGVSSKKRKHSVSDKKSPPAVPEKRKKKLKKAHKPKPTEVATTPK